ncbi:Hypothetical protein NTJ_13119 [Nesidiocoris tenuis]|uniref:Uncharacterized protein n=1 Tax=Nesidiocoris tenuis TaxID=355587 RepID=A0ABN7B7F0_9HEMI|nr:Hypothetical protein NTJ_13119 [Nesidiocoris tenuis]
MNIQEHQSSDDEELIVRLPSETDLIEMMTETFVRFPSDSDTANINMNKPKDNAANRIDTARSKSNLFAGSNQSTNDCGIPFDPMPTDCLNFTRREREATYVQNRDLFKNWQYTDEERAFLRHMVEMFSKEQCILNCILAQMLLSPEELGGSRCKVPEPDEARQTLLTLTVGSHWAIFDLAFILAFSEKINVLLRTFGNANYRSLLTESRYTIECYVKSHVLEDTASPFLLYTN